MTLIYYASYYSLFIMQSRNANLSWKCQVYGLSIKLNRASALLFKINKYASPKILRSIYIVIFKSQLSYWSLVWAENFRIIQQIAILQKKAVRITSFQPRNFYTCPLFKQSYKIMKFDNKISLENILFDCKSVKTISV